MLITPSQLTTVAELYDRALYVQAYAEAVKLAPLADWEGTAARVLGGRLAIMLGAPKLGRKHHQYAWRHDRQHPEAIYFYARLLMDRNGPLRAWRFLKQQGELPDAPAWLRADWYGMHAIVLGHLRDFDAAEEYLARAEQADPGEAYLWVERSTLCELEDRYEDALAAARRSLQLHDWYRPAVQAAAHNLILLEREDEALELLREGDRRIECTSVTGQLAQLLTDRGDYEGARAAWDRCAELSPLLEPDEEKWLNGRRSDAAYLCGDYERATALAEQTDHPFYKLVVERIKNSAKDNGNARRKLLDVRFIRQHHMTCAPATLTMISKYWQMPADHLSVAEEICYGGTADHSERKWAEQQGWAAREFAVNWDDARKLLERGVVFTLATVDPGNAHLQTVIGFDERRGTLLIRDPYLRSLGEGLGDEMTKHYRSTGPRGMALVPKEQAHLLAELELNESLLYDQLHAVQTALAKHDRARAQEVCAAMAAAAPDHRLTLNAQLAIAWYDDDQLQVLACIEALMAQFPEDVNLRLNKLGCLRSLARHSERIEYLKSLCEWRRDENDEDDDAKPAANDNDGNDKGNNKDENKDGAEAVSAARPDKQDPKRFDPLFWLQYAGELSNDARQHTTALRLINRVLRYRPMDAGTIHLLANIRWAQRQFDEAAELYRFAACLRDTDEQYVQSYFVASRHLRRTQEALRHLENRFKRFAKRSGFPTRTLSWAHEQVGNMAEALNVLQQGLTLRPTDGDLLLYAADVYARHGDFDAAAQRLAQAEGKVSRTYWLRASAAIASYRGELREATTLWRQVLETEPLALDAYRNLAQLVAETESREAALVFLRAATARFPHNLPLHQLLIEWLRDEPEEAEAVLRHVTEIEPVDAWSRRELAYKLVQQRRLEPALIEAELGRALEPDNPYGSCAVGVVCAELGRTDEAKEAFREAIRLSVDTDFAIGGLLELSHTPAERRVELDFIGAELTRQVTFGDGLIAYRQQAKTALTAEETLSLLQGALAARPDLWQAWTVVIHQFSDMERLDEALQLAEQATERFPLVPRVWLDLAQVRQVRLDFAGEMAALTQALRINPGWGYTSQQISEVHTRAGEFQQAREVLERAITYAPLDQFNHGCLADVLWVMGEKAAAVERLQHALTIDPTYEWAWRCLRDWSQELKRPQVAAECARDLTKRRPGQSNSWLTLARTLTEAQDLPERLAAMDRAVELSPRSLEAHSLRVQLLANAKRFDEARAACRPIVFGTHVPAELRQAAANVEAERGDLPAAVKLLRELVKDEPNYFSGWFQLAEWLRLTESYEDYLQVATEMARLAPHYPLALGFLSEAKLVNRDRAGAKEALRHALQLDPRYEFAATKLYDLQLADDDLDAARETLDILRRYIGGNTAKLCELRLALRDQDYLAAKQCLRELCVAENLTRPMLDAAIAESDEEEWQRAVSDVLNETIDKQNANPQAGIVWVERCAEKQTWGECEGRLDSLTERGELWREASITLLEVLAKAGKKDRLRGYVRRHHDVLWGDLQTWANVGYALMDIGDRQAAVDWLNDYPQRAGLQPWMLWNLVLALRELGRERQAYEVGAYALQLPPDHLNDAHALLLAADDWFNGARASATKRLEHINVGALREWDRFVYDVVQALLDFEPGGNSAGETVDWLNRVAQAAAFFNRNPVLVDLHWRAVTTAAWRSSTPWVIGKAYARLLAKAAVRALTQD